MGGSHTNYLYKSHKKTSIKQLLQDRSPVSGRPRKRFGIGFLQPVALFPV